MQLDQVGFIGWRGMVGSVLLQRMRAAGDFAAAPAQAASDWRAPPAVLPPQMMQHGNAALALQEGVGDYCRAQSGGDILDAQSGMSGMSGTGMHIARPVFFSTSQTGQPGPDIGREIPPLRDAHDFDALAEMDVIVTCQGGDYTAATHSALRARGWDGYWIDAASTLRLAEDSCMILDPVNRAVIDRELARGRRDFIGGNCTVSLMLMALHGLFAEDCIEWMSVNTYQAISGGGARQMRELLAQMGALHAAVAPALNDSASSILDIDARAAEAQLPLAEIGVPLAGNLLPWIDRDLDNGISREEQKGARETLKILGRDPGGVSNAAAPLDVHSTCVRVGVLRCHSQAFTLKLRPQFAQLPLAEIAARIAGANPWVRLVENQRDDSLAHLTPAAVSGTLDIAVGRLRKLSHGCFSAFTVGDQLLWGAAEPLRRMLRILAAH